MQNEKKRVSFTIRKEWFITIMSPTKYDNNSPNNMDPSI